LPEFRDAARSSLASRSGRSQVVRPGLRVRRAGAHLDGDLPRYPKVDAARQQDLAETKGLLEAKAPKDAAPDPARAELTARAKEEQAAKENKQARKQRKRMKRIMEKLAEAKRSER
jgi:hypothetical protein